MSKCVICKKREGLYPYSEGGKVCEQCVGSCFTCPDCGMIYPLETGDSGDGFCSECASEH